MFGIGAYGAVCNAECDDLPCAAKILHPTIFAVTRQYQVAQRSESIRRFEQECKLICTVKHPNIVQYFGIHRDAVTGQPALLMELMDDNLTHFLESSPNTIPYHIQVNFCRDIALALSFLHSNDIIHRNLSGNNVLLIRNVLAKVSDFGMARLSSFDSQASHLTYTMSPATRAYMPPEAFKHDPNYDEKVDCFSFGVIAVQIVTQKFPSPTDRHKPLETDNGSNAMAYIVPELERRENHISTIDPNHPLLPIACLCLKDDSAERPSAQMLYKKVKTLQESGEYLDSVSGTVEQSNIPDKGANVEKSRDQGNELKPFVDAGTNTPDLEQTRRKWDSMKSLESLEEWITEEPQQLPDEEHKVIVIAAEVYPATPEQADTSKKDIPSDQHQSKHGSNDHDQDRKQKSQEAVPFDHDEERLGTRNLSVPVQYDEIEVVSHVQDESKSQEETERDSSTTDGGEKRNVDASVPLPTENIVNESTEDMNKEERNKPVEDDSVEIHNLEKEDSAEEQFKSNKESKDVNQATVVVDVKMITREESEKAVTVQDNRTEDNQSMIQEREHDTRDKNEEEGEPVEDGGAEDDEPKIQENKCDNVNAGEQPKQESKGNDASATEQPKQESKGDDVSAMDKNEGTKNVDGKETKSKSSKKGKEMHTCIGAELADEITILSSETPATNSDKGVMKTDDNSEKAGNAQSNFN